MKKLLLALVCLTAASCRPAMTDSLVWARSADSSTLDPAEIEWGEDAKVAQSIFEPLVTFRQDSVELEGRLAESWSFSPDGKTLAFDLREGVTFHDGTAFDAGDVVFTFERLMNREHPYRPKASPYAFNFSMIDSVKAEGDGTVIFKLKEPSATVLFTLTLFSAGIVSPESVRERGDQWPMNPVGTGPYRLARWDRDVRIVLERFAEYWGTPPAIERVIVVPVQSPQTAIQKLRQGEVHVVDHPTLADIRPLQEDGATTVDSETSMNVCYLGFNLNKSPYNDKNFRLAVSLALDRSSLNNLAYYDLAEPAVNIVPPAIWKNMSPVLPYEYNIERAKELLAKVKLDSPEVELMHMTFARPYVPEPQRVAEWVKDQLRKIGLEVRLTGYDIQAYTLKTREPDHPMYLMGWNMDYPDPDNFLYPLLHGDNAGDLNGSFFNDPEFNAAVSQAQRELDASRRAALYARAYERYREEQPTIPLVHVRQLIALSRAVSYNLHPAEYRFYAAGFVR